MLMYNIDISDQVLVSGRKTKTVLMINFLMYWIGRMIYISAMCNIRLRMQRSDIGLDITPNLVEIAASVDQTVRPIHGSIHSLQVV